MKSINPSNDNLINDYAEHSQDEILDILAKTESAWKAWRGVGMQERSRLMHGAAKLLREKQDEYARLMTLEMGKPIKESRAEAEKCAWVCDYYADEAGQFLQDELVETGASKSFVAFEPLGIVLAVMPWNFPFWQVFRFAAPALMAGNAGLLKHASNVPGCALAIESIFKDAGFPEHLFRSLMIPARDVEAVIKDKRVKAVTLTGSEPAGMQVAAIAGRELKKTVLELGGSDPFIVLEDADLEECISTAVKARMINTGQSCIAAKRFIVVESVQAEFEKTMAEMMSALKVGDPLDSQNQVGPMARKDLRDELHTQVVKTLEQGGRLLTSGDMVEGSGAYYKPTVVSDVKAGMPLYHEETFGPVAAIIPVKSSQEAIDVANDSDFGLGASLWTQNTEWGESLARQVESGAVFVNGMTVSDPRLPFGGIKRSGYGRELSHFGIREFVNIKSIWIK